MKIEKRKGPVAFKIVPPPIIDPKLEFSCDACGSRKIAVSEKMEAFELAIYYLNVWAEDHATDDDVEVEVSGGSREFDHYYFCTKCKEKVEEFLRGLFGGKE